MFDDSVYRSTLHQVYFGTYFETYNISRQTKPLIGSIKPFLPKVIFLL